MQQAIELIENSEDRILVFVEAIPISDWQTPSGRLGIEARLRCFRGAISLVYVHVLNPDGTEQERL